MLCWMVHNDTLKLHLFFARVAKEKGFKERYGARLEFLEGWGRGVN